MLADAALVALSVFCRIEMILHALNVEQVRIASAAAEFHNLEEIFLILIELSFTLDVLHQYILLLCQLFHT